MSLYLTELKVKAALELIGYAKTLNEKNNSNEWSRARIHKEPTRTVRVLHEIIDRPKDE